MLYTNLKHIETASDYAKAIENNVNVVIICGRMDISCIPVFNIVEEFESKYKKVNFYDMELDNPESDVLKNVVEYYDIQNMPLIGYFRNGNLIEVSLGCQTKQQMSIVLNKVFGATVNV